MNSAYRAQERRELLRFARQLARYGCAGVDQEPDNPAMCGKCCSCGAYQWLKARELLEAKPKPELTPREREVLDGLVGNRWMRPMDLGGSDASDHSAVLKQLVIKGYAEMRRRNSFANYLRSSRGSYEYRRVRE